jgi:hypothetical protein
LHLIALGGNGWTGSEVSKEQETERVNESQNQLEALGRDNERLQRVYIYRTKIIQYIILLIPLTSKNFDLNVQYGL